MAVITQYDKKLLQSGTGIKKRGNYLRCNFRTLTAKKYKLKLL